MFFGCKLSWLQFYQILLESDNIWPSNHKNKKDELLFETQFRVSFKSKLNVCQLKAK